MFELACSVSLSKSAAPQQALALLVQVPGTRDSRTLKTSTVLLSRLFRYKIVRDKKMNRFRLYSFII